VSEQVLISSDLISLLMPTPLELQAIAAADHTLLLNMNWGLGYPTTGDVLLAGLAIENNLHVATSKEPWGVLQIQLNQNGFVVGGIGFKSAPVNGVVEIGYGVSEDFQNRGITTDAVLLMIEVAKLHGLKILTAETEITNIASQKVLLKSGFSKSNATDTNIEWQLKL
jgi:RimJ/RimL family protein N-acetyltransferase